MDANDQRHHLGALGVHDVQFQFSSTDLRVNHILIELKCLQCKRYAEAAGNG